MTITIARFHKDATLQWNEFLVGAKNTLFLFHRAYMEYHEDRFTDHSLMIFKQGKLVALFPANEKQDFIYSHAGLTYGGLLFSRELKGSDAVRVIEVITEYYRKQGIKEMYYKAIPSIFHSYPCQEDLYALFRKGAELYRRDLSSVIDLSAPIRFSETKRQAISKCTHAGVMVVENQDFSEYWTLLTEVLVKFDVSPVHSLSEIRDLKKKFPDKIRLFEARLSNELIAGVVIYDYDSVVHTQYMANSSQGRSLGALDLVNATLINEEYKHRKYFSFGTSTEEEGKVINEGLLLQKEMMGGRAIVNDFYKIRL